MLCELLLSHDCTIDSEKDVGFIHMLFPKALILHVAREPMDTIFSAYKHEFPPGPLDYTSSFDSLAELYHGKTTIISGGSIPYSILLKPPILFLLNRVSRYYGKSNYILVYRLVVTNCILK